MIQDNGSYGFNLRGSKQYRGHVKQRCTFSIFHETTIILNFEYANFRGQFVRSVDFSGPAHEYGLKAGDRLLAVNGVVCEDESHDIVTDMIRSTSPSKHLELIVRISHMHLKFSKIFK